MIRNILIENFRCYRRLEISRTARLNIIVGENGSGKTALLEAIFLALGRSPELGIRFRQHRGLEGAFSGPLRRVEEALWRSLFYKGDWDRQIKVQLSGDGPESRSVYVMHGQQQLSIPLNETDIGDESISAPINFIWRNHLGREFTITPTVKKDTIEMVGTEEDNPDFFLFPANQLISSSETASRFSMLSRRGGTGRFVRMLSKEYPFIKDISIEVEAGQPLLFASIKGQNDKIPLAYVSGGINRIVSILVAMAVSRHTVILVDEIENGIYYKHLPSICRMLYNLANDGDLQLILSTHSEEWLTALTEQAGIPEDSYALWRTSREKHGHIVEQFSGDTLKAGIQYGQEVRGD